MNAQLFGLLLTYIEFGIGIITSSSAFVLRLVLNIKLDMSGMKTPLGGQTPRRGVQSSKRLSRCNSSTSAAGSATIPERKPSTFSSKIDHRYEFMIFFRFAQSNWIGQCRIACRRKCIIRIEWTFTEFSSSNVIWAQHERWIFARLAELPRIDSVSSNSLPFTAKSQLGHRCNHGAADA